LRDVKKINACGNIHNKVPILSFQEKPIIAVNKWDGSAVKNALDDAVKDVRFMIFFYYLFKPSNKLYPLY
jgi:hypothetical protein